MAAFYWLHLMLFVDGFINRLQVRGKAVFLRAVNASKITTLKQITSLNPDAGIVKAFASIPNKPASKS